MGAGTSRSGSAANLNDAGAFVREQEQKAAAQKQYEVDKRSQYESLPQSLRDKVSFEDAYADRGPAATGVKNNTGPTRNLSSPGSEPNYADRGPAATREAIQERQGIGRDSSSDYFDRADYFDRDKFNRLKAEVDQQRSRNNTGIAFGPGRSNRGYVNLNQLQRARTRGR